MKITFVYPDVVPHRLDWTGYFYSGIGSLSAALKEAGHRTSLIHITQPIGRQTFIKRIRDEDSDLIGFSSTSNMFSIVRKLASWLVEARVKVPTICGGIHPTIAPEESIRLEGMDMICRGEGEAPLVELCNKMENKEGISNIQNLWVKRNDNLIKNALRPLLKDLDALPFPDRSIYSYQSLYSEREGRGSFIASRGCPYNCTYCSNHLLRTIYGMENRPVRFRSVDNVIDEIRQVLKNYPFIKTLVFDDDILFLNRKWSEQFSEKYRQEINLPFVCNARADVTDEAMITLLKNARCAHVKFGLESGNEEIRYKVLNRRMTDDQIKKAFAICTKAGIITESFNMVGIPHETPGAILDTIKLNATIGVDKMQVSIYQPFVGTELGELCRKQQLLESTDLAHDIFSSSILNLGTVSSSQVLMFRDYFKVLVRYYQLLQRLPLGISKISMRLSDQIFVLDLSSRALNLIYLPLNYLFQRLRALRFKTRMATHKVDNDFKGD
jgi:radical SAM superfamily enzyme YgiQ (UPF0313 family)